MRVRVGVAYCGRRGFLVFVGRCVAGFEGLRIVDSCNVVCRGLLRICSVRCRIILRLGISGLRRVRRISRVRGVDRGVLASCLLGSISSASSCLSSSLVPVVSVRWASVVPWSVASSAGATFLSARVFVGCAACGW